MWRRSPELLPIEDLEVIRTGTAATIGRFAELIGVPAAPARRRARWLAGDPAKGP